MKILGPFLSVEDADVFFFMRGFPDLESRGPMKDKFYEGELWKRELEHELLPMLEEYDVVLVEGQGGLGTWHWQRCRRLVAASAGQAPAPRSSAVTTRSSSSAR